jgi:hypothetical protein
MRRKLALFVILAVITSVLFIHFNQCDSECRRPRISDAVEDGRQAAFLILAGRPDRSAIESSWSYPAAEKVKNLQGFYLPPSNLEVLMREVGVRAVAPLLPEIENLEPVALDTWENAATITYKYESFDEPVEIAGKGPLLIAVSLRYAIPSDGSWLEKMRDHLPHSWVVNSRWLMNLGRKKGHWSVFDFAFTGTLNEYFEWILKDKDELVRSNRPRSSSEAAADAAEFVKELSPERFDPIAVAQADIDFTAKWSQERSIYQMRRFTQTRDEWNAVEEAINASFRKK